MKIKPKPSVKRMLKKKKKKKTLYLNESVNMTAGHSVGGHLEKNLEVVSSDNPMSPVHSQSLVTPDGRHARINLLLVL